MLRDIIRHLLTESNNETHDIIRYLGALSVVWGLACQAYAIYKGQPFDMMQFGTGIGALLGGVGVALKLKKETGE